LSIEVKVILTEIIASSEIPDKNPKNSIIHTALYAVTALAIEKIRRHVFLVDIFELFILLVCMWIFKTKKH